MKNNHLAILKGGDMYSLFSTLGGFAALGFFITLVWLIVKAIRKRPKKKMAIICVSTFVAVIVFMQISENTEEGKRIKAEKTQLAKEMAAQQVVVQQAPQQIPSSNDGNVIVRFNKETGKSEVVAEAPATQPSPSQPQFVSTNFKDFNAQFGIDSKLTDVQKDELFKSKYKGKPVKWRGEVTEITKNWGSVNIQVKHLRTTFTSDVIIAVKKSEENKAMQLSKGDTITYTGVLESWGTIMPHSVDEGEIINE